MARSLDLEKFRSPIMAYLFWMNCFGKFQRNVLEVMRQPLEDGAAL